MAQGEKEGIPHIIVVNHLDRERTDFGAVVDELRERFGQAVVPLNLPIGSENDLKGIYGLLTGTSFVDGEQREEIPEGMEDEVDTAKTQLFEAIAESDDTLLEKYLEGDHHRGGFRGDPQGDRRGPHYSRPRGERGAYDRHRPPARRDRR